MSPVLVSSCLAYTVPAGMSLSSAASHHGLQLLVGELGEEVDGAQVGDVG